LEPSDLSELSAKFEGPNGCERGVCVLVYASFSPGCVGPEEIKALAGRQPEVNFALVDLGSDSGEDLALDLGVGTELPVVKLYAPRSSLAKGPVTSEFVGSKFSIRDVEYGVAKLASWARITPEDAKEKKSGGCCPDTSKEKKTGGCCPDPEKKAGGCCPDPEKKAGGCCPDTQKKAGGCCPDTSKEKSGGCCPDTRKEKKAGSCCPDTSKDQGKSNNGRTHDLVRMAYAATVTGGAEALPFDVGDPHKRRELLGYAEEEISKSAELGLGCGNPLIAANLKPGEVVVDLGSGAGMDCFIAGKQVGPTGHVIGVDMTPEMLAKARGIAQQDNVTNVTFRMGEIEHLPVGDQVVDCVISNCVINLSPEKMQVYREMNRILRPGGRVSISDVMRMGELPDELKNAQAYAC